MQGQTKVGNALVCSCNSWRPEHVWPCICSKCCAALLSPPGTSLQVAVYKAGSVKGLSTLRPKEEKPAELSEAAKARQKYLDQMYGGGSAAVDPGAKLRRKRKRLGSSSLPGGVKVGHTVRRTLQVYSGISPPLQCH